ncbi:site-specific integrase [Candidatus Synechococcus calcipolaris G9]|uniref:Site-specific integrase n=1 Tax=Candidatus Synechococcus calcipolaris G9 TaxID=1497997 RepID=A0ABT6EUE6_9SYNE|nr:site-specific integrase [Candidatus Synechococcus calcipolaris]MDG2989503.1 site-specific integrase [Candidatus Synechococcus calcipolaris G9]
MKSSHVGVTIQAIGDRLYLRATFPPKPGSSKTEPYQQRIALGVRGTPAGVSFAEKEARKVGALLDCQQFDWGPYLHRDATDSVGDWVNRFEKHYFNQRERNDKTQTTWDGDYHKVFKGLPPDEPLTGDLLHRTILNTRPDSKTRRRACMALGALASFAGIELDLTGLRGSYSPQKSSPREIPDDRLISEIYYELKNRSWAWVYGMLATYGLRPHEIFRLNYETLSQGDRIVQVQGNTKTGYRRVWPCYPEWFDEFGLSHVSLPPINRERPNLATGRAVGQYLRKYLPSFTPYDLRHAWAIRTLEYGLDLTLAAQQMGHSVQVHSQTYHHWISERHHQRAFEALMLRPDRPLPP